MAIEKGSAEMNIKIGQEKLKQVEESRMYISGRCNYQ